MMTEVEQKGVHNAGKRKNEGVHRALERTNSILYLQNYSYRGYLKLDRHKFFTCSPKSGKMTLAIMGKPTEYTKAIHSDGSIINATKKVAQVGILEEG